MNPRDLADGIEVGAVIVSFSYAILDPGIGGALAIMLTFIASQTVLPALRAGEASG